MATTESSASRATPTTREDGPRYRVRFVADGREHDAHAAFIAREDAEQFRAALLENLDVSSAHVLCPQCEDSDDEIDGVGICEDCTAEPLMSAQPWSVDPAYRALFTAEACEQCGVFVNVPDEGIHTDDDYVLCHGCALDGMPARMWARLRQERTS